jgi:DNA-binding SARP family transcriptional activator
MWIGILGPVELRHGGVRLGPRPGRGRSLLALLALNSGCPVGHDRIVDLLWDDPPGSARAQVYNLVSDLRRRMRDGVPPGAPHSARASRVDALVSVDGGYLLRSTEHTSDLRDFRAAVALGRESAAAARHDRAAEQLSAALGHWRGTALTGCREPFAEAARRGLEEERLRAVVALLDARLALGQHEQVLAETGPWLANHPHREDLYGRQMLAHAALGRQADAVADYRRAYRRLRDDLGVTPGHRLQDIYRRILADSPEARPARPAAPATETRRPGPVPRQLPPQTERLLGREAPAAAVRAALLDRGAVVPVVALTGPGGVGKSALALHVAHALADEFPGGQLYADLHGLRERPAEPHRTLARFLHALGVDARDVPADPEERVAEFRSRVAGRRLLVVLDDAADEKQLRPLLPGTPDCAVLVTSRNRLTGLGGLGLEVSTLEPAAAQELLTRLVGEDRTGAEPAATADVARLCGCLPLALRIAGARLSSRPDWTVSGFRDRLARQRERLDLLTAGDLDVRAGIALSYRSLPAEFRCAVRRLGLLEARSVPGWVVGALAGAPTADDRHADFLVERHLLEAVGVDRAGQSRYRLHDLVHDFAYERAAAEDTPGDRDAALGRVLRTWCVLAAEAAGRLGHGAALDPVTPAGDPLPAVVSVVRRRPLDWFAAERLSLISAIHLAGRLDRPRVAGDLALQLDGYLVIRYDEAERVAVLRAAIACWRDQAAPDRRLARLYFALCWATYQQDRYAELDEAATHALAVATRVGDPDVVADATWQVAKATALRGRLPDAAELYRRSLTEALRQRQPERSLTYAHTGLANVLADLGRPAEAAGHYRHALSHHRAKDRTRVVILLRFAEALADDAEGGQALELLAEAQSIVGAIGDEVGAAHVERLRGLVDIARRAWEPASDRLRTALTSLRAHHEALGVVHVLRALGDAALGTGRPAAGGHRLAEALAVCRPMGAPVETARVEARLAAAFRLSGEPDPAEAYADAYRRRLTSLSLPDASLRLPGHVRALLPPARPEPSGRNA